MTRAAAYNIAVLLVLAAAAPASAQPASWLEGEWRAWIPLDRDSIQVLVDVAPVRERWFAEVDVPALHAEDYLVEIEPRGRDVALTIDAAHVTLLIRQTGNPRTLRAYIDDGGRRTTVTLTRVGEARLSDALRNLQFTGIARLQDLSPSAVELRAQFNADRSDTRLVMLLSPSSPSSQNAARTISADVLRRLKGDGLRVYAVWESILRADNEAAALTAAALVSDPRVTHFWATSPMAGTKFQDVIGVGSRSVWNVYLVYPPGVVWGDEVPRPSLFMLQMPGGPPSRRLVPSVLADSLRAALERK
jgi:hypothetical protein